MICRTVLEMRIDVAAVLRAHAFLRTEAPPEPWTPDADDETFVPLLGDIVTDATRLRRETRGALRVRAGLVLRGSQRGPHAVAGKAIGPSFAADEVPDVIEAVIDVYRRERQGGERFIDTARRLGTAPFRSATDAVRRSTAAARTA